MAPSQFRMKIGQFLALMSATWCCSMVSLLCLEIVRRSPTPVQECSKPVLIEICIDGRRGAWETRYPGGDGLLMTSDDVTLPGKVLLPEHSRIHCRLTSSDFIYALDVSDDAIAIAVPGMTRTTIITTTDRSRRNLKSTPFCGQPFGSHDAMGELVVGSWEEVRELFGTATTPIR